MYETEEQKRIREEREKEHKKQIEEWCQMKIGETLFDSDIDDWSQNTSVFNEKIIGKKQLLFLIEDIDGEKFGYYLNTEIIEKYGKHIATDNKSFHFNIQSNGRIQHPMKFEIKNSNWGGYKLFKKTDSYLIFIGNISLKKKSYKESYCEQDEELFDYHGIENALCGKEHFISKRILVIQMK